MLMKFAALVIIVAVSIICSHAIAVADFDAEFSKPCVAKGEVLCQIVAEESPQIVRKLLKQSAVSPLSRLVSSQQYDCSSLRMFAVPEFDAATILIVLLSDLIEIGLNSISRGY